MNPRSTYNTRIQNLLQGLPRLNTPSLSLFWAPNWFFPICPTVPLRTTVPYLNLLSPLMFNAPPINRINPNLYNSFVNRLPDVATPAPSTDSTTTEPSSNELIQTNAPNENEIKETDETDSNVTVTEIKSETESSTPENVKPETTSLKNRKVDFRSVETLSQSTPFVDSQRVNQNPTIIEKNLKRSLKRSTVDGDTVRKRRKQNDTNAQSNQVMCYCEFCGKGFSRQWLLQGHIRTHTGEKPFKCQICEKPFADKSNLRAHVQTHSDEKPFICVRCGKRFALKSYLSKHEESACSLRNRPRSILENPGLSLNFSFGPSLVFR